jgi:DNA replication and repair protein RecF
VDTDSDLVVIVGPNASGKTNFLECIYFLSRLKSFRAPDNLLVSTQEDYFKITANYNNQKLETIIQVYPKLARSFKLDDQKIRRMNWKTFATVLFVPQDLNIFDLGPSYRRKFLDQTLSQVSMQYALDLATLDHVLKQRSALFDQIVGQQASVADLAIWNTELARVSVSINKLRIKFIDFLNSKLEDTYKNLTDFGSRLKLIYKGIGVSTEPEFLEKLGQYQLGEVRSGQNLYGPHRDDFIIEKDDKENIYNSSRGELRAQVLTLKLLQAEYLKSHKLNPIILLDDVFSELDEVRRTKLIESLSGSQIFITTTEEHHLPDLGRDAQILTAGANQLRAV